MKSITTEHIVFCGALVR